MPKKINLIGLRFGRLLVTGYAQSDKGRTVYLCACDCGGVKATPSTYLRTGTVQSCGCLRRDAAAENGRRRKKESPARDNALYKRWSSMKQRCGNPKNPHFKNYGARGIYVCDAWANSFDAFLADMGAPPSRDHTLERIDNSIGYEPENCEWVLRDAQMRNQRRTILVTCAGETLCGKDWAKKAGVPYQLLTKTFRRSGIEAVRVLIEESLARNP
jgi:hypothetical protein